MSLYFDFLKNDEVRKRDIKKERIVIVKISICKKKSITSRMTSDQME